MPLKIYVIAVITFCLAGIACSTSKYAATNSVYKKQVKQFSKEIRRYPLTDSAGYDFVGTTNLTMRRPQLVILHHTAQDSCAQTLRTFTLPRTGVSSHYVVCRKGNVYQMLNNYLRGHHAGVSFWNGQTDLNSNSIGIEIDNNGSEPFSEPQIQGLLELLGNLKRQYNLPAKAFIGHADIAPGRKVDPSRFFPWKILADKGFGLWYDTTNVQLPDNFDPMLALRIVGYHIAKPENAIQSYKIHFVPADTTRTLSPADHKILYSLMKQSL